MRGIYGRPKQGGALEAIERTVPCLEVEDLTKRYGGIAALTSVSFAVPAGQILGIAGANGSGKSTLLNVISGFARPTKGGLLYFGESIIHASPCALVKRGIARTFQETTIFPSLSIGEHLAIALNRPGFTSGDEEILELLAHSRLADYRHAIASEVSYGMQKLLGFAVADAMCPRLLMVDEPGSGLNEAELNAVGERIRRSGERGTTVVVVDHNVPFLLGLCDRLLVFNMGELIFDGVPNAALDDEAVVRSYLGSP